jgi:hypothetical protein
MIRVVPAGSRSGERCHPRGRQPARQVGHDGSAAKPTAAAGHRTHHRAISTPSWTTRPRPSSARTTTGRSPRSEHRRDERDPAAVLRRVPDAAAANDRRRSCTRCSRCGASDSRTSRWNHDEAVRAAGRIVCTSKWLPSVAEFRAALGEVHHGARRTGAEAWGDVRRLFSYRERAAMADVDPVVLEVCTAQGWIHWRTMWRNGEDIEQWHVAMGEDANPAADRARFIELYDALTVGERKAAQLAPGGKIPERTRSARGRAARCYRSSGCCPGAWSRDAPNVIRIEVTAPRIRIAGSFEVSLRVSRRELARRAAAVAPPSGGARCSCTIGILEDELRVAAAERRRRRARSHARRSRAASATGAISRGRCTSPSDGTP